MRTMVLLGGLVAAAVSASAADRVTVDQLEQRVAANLSRSDENLAHRLQSLELTQRLSTRRLEKLQEQLPGPESRNALMSVADLSVVLDPPAAEIPADPAPSAAEQQQMLARAQAASDSAADRMPDFDATVHITRFRNLKFLTTSNSAPVPLVEPEPQMLDADIDAVTHRLGRVFITHVKQTWTPEDTVKTGVESWEGLYTVLANVRQDMRGAQPEWVRWEQGPVGRLAVFRFSMAPDHAQFPIRTVIDPQARRGFKGQPGYRAEVALDPATGAVYRFALRAVIDPGQHVQRTDAVAEFAPAAVDGKTFLCPLRSVTIAVAQSKLSDFNITYGDFGFQRSEDIRPLMHVSDVEFGSYRMGHWNAPDVADRAFLANALALKGEQVNTEQLEKIVADLGGVKDQAAADRLGKLDLTQRLTEARYARLRSRLPGKASGDALLALRDLAEFEALPRGDRVDAPAPDATTQGKMIVKAVEFVAGVTNKMPDLFATRQLSRFEDLHVVRGTSQPSAGEITPLRMVGNSTSSVHFREGREVVEAAAKVSQVKPYVPGLDTWGTFGPLLTIVMADMLKARVGWSHWESGAAGRLAVFRYEVPEADSHYKVQFCCYLGEDGLPSSYASTPGYHGELAVDPETGAVMRLVLRADVRPEVQEHVEQEQSPLLRNDVLVEYGGVDIAGRQYVTPQRTVSVMTSWTLGSQGPVKYGLAHAEGVKQAKKAMELMEFSRVNAINEAVFKDYHVFRSEVRLVADPGDAGTETPKQ